MPQRLERRGRLIARDGQGLAVAVESACAHCAAGCQAPLSGPALDVGLTPAFSGRIGDQVTLSVSGSGLTLASALVFAPAIGVLLGSPWITATMDPYRGLLATLAAFVLALLGGGALARSFAARLVRPELQTLGGTGSRGSA